MTSYKHQNLCFYCKQFNHRQDECRTRIQDNQPCTDSRGRKCCPKRYTNEETTQGMTSLISALTSYVTPLRGSRAVLPQLILNICLASLTTCDKLYEIFALGEKIRPRINVKTGNQTTSCIIRHWSRHHMHEQPIIQRRIWNTKTEEDIQCSELCRRFLRCNELHRGL